MAHNIAGAGRGEIATENANSVSAASRRTLTKIRAFQMAVRSVVMMLLVTASLTNAVVKSAAARKQETDLTVDACSNPFRAVTVQTLC